MQNLSKIIIDTDPGVDDALAIMFAIAANQNVVALTTVFGNASIENTTQNTGKILGILQKEIPIYQGVAMPLVGVPIFAKSHGEDGFGGYESQKSIIPQKETALSYMIQILENSGDQEIEIIVLGPATNIALLGIYRPDLIKKIKRLIILGGVLSNGNITPYAEFNVYNDPLAFKSILNFSCAKVVIPIDVCRKVYFTLQDFDQIQDRLGQTIKKIAAQYISYYQSKNLYGTFPGGVMYDLLATGYSSNAELFTTESAYLEVNIRQDQIEYGQTYKLVAQENNCNIVTDVNVDVLKKLFFSRINTF